MLAKIISGGQTGADMGGLVAGSILGIPTGGWAPKGWMTELGPNKLDLMRFGLVECKTPGYPDRTALNVKDSDGTVLFGRLNSSGSKLTSRFIQHYRKPNLHLDVPWLMQDRKHYLIRWIAENKIYVLNVAGNRESVNTGIEAEVAAFLIEALS